VCEIVDSNRKLKSAWPWCVSFKDECKSVFGKKIFENI
jgi:hypothetical protein